MMRKVMQYPPIGVSVPVNFWCKFGTFIGKKCLKSRTFATGLLTKRLQDKMKANFAPIRMALRTILPLFLAMAVSSCGSDNSFRINGKISNFGTGNLRVVYYADGAVQSVMAPAIDGKFSMTGRIERPSFARIYTGNGLVAGKFIVKPGENIEAEFNMSDPTEIKLDGDDDSKRLAGFITEHAETIRKGDTAALNEAIARYVSDNPRRIVSGALMADYFDARGHEEEAMELIGKLDDEVVAAASLTGVADLMRKLAAPADSLRLEPFPLFFDGDSIVEINPQACPATILMFTDADSRNADSITAALSVWHRQAKAGKLQVIDISCDTDTATWHASLRETAPADSVGKSVAQKIRRCWSASPYNLQGLEQMPVATVPWFVVADSTRRILYRGASLTAARSRTPVKTDAKR